MLRVLTPASLAWLALCALGGAVVGATIARIPLPLSTPYTLDQLAAADRLKMAIGATAGLLAFVLLGLGAGALDGTLPGAWRVAFSVCAGGVLGAALSLLLATWDYHELMVAMYDFQGALLIIGALVGGAAGGVRGVLVSAPGGLLGQVLLGALMLLLGSGGGLVVGVILAFALQRFMYRFAGH